MIKTILCDKDEWIFPFLFQGIHYHDLKLSPLFINIPKAANISQSFSIIFISGYLSCGLTPIFWLRIWLWMVYYFVDPFELVFTYVNSKYRQLRFLCINLISGEIVIYFVIVTYLTQLTDLLVNWWRFFLKLFDETSGFLLFFFKFKDISFKLLHNNVLWLMKIKAAWVSTW